ncbi:MAG: D-xylose transport system substrate-binding protein [Solirubrobacteraceae bacterium]|jgi:D-xylose transport system substrate-binding protein|nr:D-xylose transport system substrate-binding protein [Solirubrobacteraceae bacterium]
MRVTGGTRRRALPLSLAAGAAALALVAAGCGSDNNKSSTSSSASSGGKKTIAFLLPENQTARYESSDRPLFEQDVAQLCPDCKVLYSNATQDASKQQQQAEAALAQGVDVMVLDPVDGAAAAAIVQQANAKKVPVISYDRLLLNSKPDYYAEFDSPSVGKIQANALVEKLKADGKKGSVVMINGAPTDNNAKLFKQGAHSVLDSSGFKIAKEYDTKDWLPANAQTEMEQAISALGKSGFVGVYAANDGTGGAAIAAMKGAGIDPSTRPVTGQDAELAGIQRIVAGEQYMTVYKPIKPLALTAATWAVALAQGKTVTGTNTKENNGTVDVPSLKIPVKAVTADKVKSTVVADGYWKASEICTAKYASACAKLGIK